MSPARRNLFFAVALHLALGIATVTNRELAPIFDVAVGCMFLAGALHGSIAAICWNNNRAFIAIGAALSTGACIGRSIEVGLWSEQRPVVGVLAWALAALGSWSIYSRAMRVIILHQQIVVDK